MDKEHAKRIEQVAAILGRLGPRLRKRLEEMSYLIWVSAPTDEDPDREVAFSKGAYELYLWMTQHRNEPQAQLTDETWNRRARAADQERKDILEGERISKAEQDEINRSIR
jgi:hypothetical protein